MERMVKLADVLAIINAGMFDLRSSHDNIALQEAIRSLPTVDVDPDPRGRGRGTKMDFDETEKGEKMGTSKKCATCYADTDEWYAIPFFYHNEVNEYISNLILCKECFEHLLDAVSERKEDGEKGTTD